MKNIEVEVRGLLSKKKYEELINKFDKEGKFIKEKDRMLLCYPDPKSGEFVRELNTDIRLRVTNGVPELITKIGKWQGAESRKELSVMLKKGDFDKLVQIFAAIGLEEGYICIRKGKIYDYKGVEFSLVEVPNHSYYFEAEKMVRENNIQKAHKAIKKVCDELRLKIFTDQEFYDYIDKLNVESNQPFHFKDYKEGYFGSVYGF